MNCPFTGLSVIRLLLATIAGFVFIFVYDYVVHYILLADAYEATKSVWRPMDETNALMHWCFVTKAAIALAFSMLYGVFVVCRKMKMSLKFGLCVGLIIGLSGFGMYPYIAIPMSLALAWFAAGIGTGLGLAIVNKYVFGCTGKTCSTEIDTPEA